MKILLRSNILKICMFMFPLILVSLNAFAAVSSITVDGVQRYFKAGESPVQNITVTNNSDKGMSLRASVYEYTHPAEDQGSKNAREEEAPNAFIFAPKLFKLKPHESRQVRMVLAKPLEDTERIYTISFNPFDFDYSDVEGSKDDIKLDIGFITSNGVLVSVSPAKPVIKVEMERHLNGYTIYNKGNIAIDLAMQRRVCFDEAEKDCHMIQGRRIYPNSSHDFELDAEKELTRYYQVYGGNGGEIKIPTAYAN